MLTCICFAVGAVTHIVKNCIAHILNTKVPLILGKYSQLFFISRNCYKGEKGLLNNYFIKFVLRAVPIATFCSLLIT